MADSSIGRGRGRGVLAGADLRGTSTSSSNSERRTFDSESTESGDANGRSIRGPLKTRKTKPEGINVKAGTLGTKVTLSANYFKINKKPSFSFSLYRVDFEPEVGNEKVRKSFVNQQSEYFGGHLYDGGNIIYLTHRLQDVAKEFSVEDRFTKELYIVKIKFTGQVIEDTDPMALMIFNTMLRRAMEGLKMELVGRNLYDARSKVKENLICVTQTKLIQFCRSFWANTTSSSGQVSSHRSVNTSQTSSHVLKYRTKSCDRKQSMIFSVTANEKTTKTTKICFAK